MSATYHTAPLMQIHGEDLALVRDVTNRTVRYCCAALLNAMRRASEKFCDRSGWFYFPVRQGMAETLGLFGKDAIRQSLVQLAELGLIERETNKNLGRNGQSRTYAYRLIAGDPRQLQGEVQQLQGEVQHPHSDCSPIDQTYIQTSDQTSMSHTQSACEKFEKSEPVEQAPPNPPARTTALVTPLISSMAVAQDQSSAAPQNLQNLRDPMAERFSATLPPWRVKQGANGYHEGFLEYLVRWLSTMPGRTHATRADAVSYVSSREFERSPKYDLDTLHARCQEWQEDEAKRRKNAELRQQNALPPVETPQEFVGVASAAAYQQYQPTQAEELTPAEIAAGQLKARKIAGMPLPPLLRQKAVEFGLDISHWDGKPCSQNSLKSSSASASPPSPSSPSQPCGSSPRLSPAGLAGDSPCSPSASDCSPSASAAQSPQPDTPGTPSEPPKRNAFASIGQIFRQIGAARVASPIDYGDDPTAPSVPPTPWDLASDLPDLDSLDPARVEALANGRP